MERLTHKAHSALGWVWATKDMQGAIDRLAAYEDTGLEPEALEAGKSLFKFLAENKSCPVGALRRVSELLDAEQDGRLVVLLRGGDTAAEGKSLPEREAEILAGLEAHGTGMPRCGQCPYKRLGITRCRERLCRDAAELIRALGDNGRVGGMGGEQGTNQPAG